MRKYLLIMSLVGSLIACKPKEDKPEDIDACQLYDAIDREMLDLHAAIKLKYNDDVLFLKKLQSAQLYWIQYRDRHLHALFPKGYDNYRKSYNRELVNSCKCKELARMTTIRVEELKVWMNEDKGKWKECPGSVNR